MSIKNRSTGSECIRRINLHTSTGREELEALRQTLISQGDLVSPSGRQKTIDVFGEPLSPRQVVEKICEDVKRQGLPAVLDYTKRIDRSNVTAETFQVPCEKLEESHSRVAPEFLATIRRVRKRVERFQKEILPSDVCVSLDGGGSLRQRYLPLDRVGVCVPGGAAAYPSTLLMTVVPAQVAGVPEIVVVAPPTSFGAENDHVLATCHELGVKTVYQVGGAQAVAAMAYGVEGLQRVDIVVGPGNLFVALAKKYVFGDVAIDSIAGPSEIVVVADDSANPETIASDMLAQAEHSPGSALLLTASESLADSVEVILSRRLEILERADLTRDSLDRFGALVITRNDEESARLADELAAEHLSIDTRDPEDTLTKIRHAGAAFLGPYSPVAAGDYAAGPSHVLPTGGTARFAAGLSANHFLRSGSVIALAKADLAEMADDIQLLAETEGLTAHRRSVEARSER